MFRAALVALALSVAAPAMADGPARIVSAGGDLTEIIYALGAGDRLVGADSTSTRPAEARELARIGYVRRLAAEGVISLAPDLVIAAHDAGPDATMAQLTDAGVNVAVAPDAEIPDEVPAKVRFVGEAIGAEGTEGLVDAITTDLAAVRTAAAKVETEPKVLFVLTLAGGAPMVGGGGTSADVMIGEAGGVNAAAAIDGWKPMNTEAIIAAAPDVIILSAGHVGRLGGLEAVMARPDLALTPAGKSGKAYPMDAMLLLGMGPEVATAIRELALLIHPADQIEAAGF
ncbi:MAG: helical backbone metal receptor [Pseudomonadota bacterium]